MSNNFEDRLEDARNIINTALQNKAEVWIIVYKEQHLVLSNTGKGSWSSKGAARNALINFLKTVSYKVSLYSSAKDIVAELIDLGEVQIRRIK